MEEGHKPRAHDDRKRRTNPDQQAHPRSNFRTFLALAAIKVEAHVAAAQLALRTGIEGATVAVARTNNVRLVEHGCVKEGERPFSPGPLYAWARPTARGGMARVYARVDRHQGSKLAVDQVKEPLAAAVAVAAAVTLVAVAAASTRAVAARVRRRWWLGRPHQADLRIVHVPWG